jgi:flagellar biosynthesis GTPase FlhF
MSENNHNEADALFATRRKKQQDEEAQKAAKLAEEERLAELERQKQQVAEEIKKLETLQALQKEQEEKKALEEQKALEEKARQEELFARKAAEKAAKKAADAEKGSFDIKKYLPFILIGAGVLVVAIVVIIIVSASSGSDKKKAKEGYLSKLVSNVDWYRVNDDGLTYAYPSVFIPIEDDEFSTGKMYYYYDEESGQVVNMEIDIDIMDDSYEYIFDNAELTLGQIMKASGVEKYTFKKYNDNIYYATDSFDDVGLDEGEISVIYGKKDDVFLQATSYISRNQTACPRNIEFEDLLTIFETILDHSSITAVG